MRTVRRGHKFGAVATVIDGWRFDSKAEARRYQQLVLLGQAGEIADLELQPSFPIVVNGVQVCKYVADFGHRELPSERQIYTDVKGMKTPLYRLKKKLVEALYGIEIQEVL